MNEPSLHSEPIIHKPWYRRELFIFMVGSIIIALVLVAISTALYTSSGASLLDLSRPGYKSVQGEVKQTDHFEAFSADGPVTKEALDKFQQSYQRQIQSVSNSSGFDGTALSDQSLNIDEPISQ